MSWEIAALVLGSTIVLTAFLLRKHPYMKKYWKYSLILIPGLLLILYRLLTAKKASSPQEDKQLNDAIDGVKEKIEEAYLESAVEVTIARTKDQELIKRLEEIKKIDSRRERAKRLAELIG